MTKQVPEMLRDAAALYEERNKLYGDNYKRFGHIMLLLFPDGLSLETADDFNRYGVFVQVVSKVSRYAEQFTAGGHPDSLDDNAVYAMMLQELDSECRSPKTAKGPPEPETSVWAVNQARGARILAEEDGGMLLTGEGRDGLSVKFKAAGAATAVERMRGKKP